MTLFSHLYALRNLRENKVFENKIVLQYTYVELNRKLFLSNREQLLYKFRFVKVYQRK